ncbi:MAG TPA: putative peptidoglycan glycosyltransferase FtsW [Planctomycetota bacterium]|nr:putative peptidoglycan glycosyltransferase FtsW [Planctomycetota bacterium]
MTKHRQDIGRVLRGSNGQLSRDVFVTTVFLLVAMGTVMVFSASAFYWSVEGDAFYFLRRHAAWLPIAVLGCLLCRSIDYRILRRHYWSLLVAAIVLLAIVLVPQLGRKENEATRWLPLGGGFQFQPSELAKIAAIVFVAGFMSADPSRKARFFSGFLVVCAAVLPLFVLILVEPDFGTAMFVLGLACFVLFLSGTKHLYFLGSALIFAPIISGFVYLRWEKIYSRLLGFLEPEKVYQVKHSLIALGSGGWTGLGLGASGQKLRFLPEPHTDFILSILGEEMGFLGSVTLLILYVVLLASGAMLVWRVRDLFGFLVGSGIIVSLASQAALNIAVATASAPTKGIPLPFVSFGGSGLCVVLAQVGLLLSIERADRESAAEEPQLEQSPPLPGALAALEPVQGAGEAAA